jgi:lipoate-protein ligase A
MVAWSRLADVEPFRRLTERRAVVHRVDHPTLVLGSTQREDVLSPSAVPAGPVEVVRRRGGGGAVLLQPGDHLWVDAWIPRDDPLWEPDVAGAAFWVGEWWRAALGSIGIGRCTVHRGDAEPGPYGRIVCFSGRGPGEVFHGGSKVMGLSQWRSREGALFHTCAYTRWQPAPLIDLLDLDAPSRVSWSAALADSAVGLVDLLGSGPAGATRAAREPVDSLAPVDRVAAPLLATFPHWGDEGPPAAG